MTKASRHLSSRKCDGNQEDAHKPEPSSRSPKLHFPLQQQHSPDWDDGAEMSVETKCRPTTLEKLLDLELDLVLPTTAIPVSKNNQLRDSVAREKELENEVVHSVSLELLAMQSPHGENQQWQHEKEESDQPQAPTRPEYSPQHTRKELATARKQISLSITSPTTFVPAFPVSPTQTSTDDDYGLASPMALPETPSQTRPGMTLAWNLEPTSPKVEEAPSRAERFRRLAQAKSVQRPERRASSSSFIAKAATPNPKNDRNFVPDRTTSRITRSSLPTLPEVRGKARHGGIYSLLLKNKPGKQEPVLVEDGHSPEETMPPPSVSKISPPRTFGEQKHGGIYKMLRTGHGPH